MVIPQKIRIPAIPVSWIVFGMFIPLEGALLIAFRLASREWKETIIFGATIVGGAFALYGHLKHLNERRAAYAQRLIARWNVPNAEFEKWKDALRNVYSGELDARSVMRTRSADGKLVLPKDIQTRNRIAGLLGFCEEVALAVRTDHADELIERLLRGVLESCWLRFKPWIEGEREVLGQKEGKDLYIELEELIKKWNKAN